MFRMLWYGRPLLRVFQDYRRACEYIFSIDTVFIRSDVSKNMAARSVRVFTDMSVKTWLLGQAVDIPCQGCRASRFV